MTRKMLTPKLHRAVVTGTKLNYKGSLTIDADLLKASDILKYEHVQVVNISSGTSFENICYQRRKGFRSSKT
jgi:aspartate 1-decarboxylase